MNNKEKYEGKTIDIYAPFGGRKLDTLYVIEVMGDNLTCIYGESEISGTETAYNLSDGIRVEIVEDYK